MEWQFDEPIPGKLGTNIPDYNALRWTHKQEVRLDKCTTALDWYKVFSSREWLEYVEDQSWNYAMAMGRESQLQHITIDNIR